MAGLFRAFTTGSISISIPRVYLKTVFESLLSTRKTTTQGGGTFAAMNSTAMAGGKSNSPQTVDIHSRSDHSIFDTKDPKQNVDLSDHGNPAPGTPVTLWRCWKGENQIWKFEQVPD